MTIFIIVNQSLKVSKIWQIAVMKLRQKKAMTSFK